MTTTETTATAAPEVDLGQLNQTHADLGAALAWLAENWRGFPKPYPAIHSDYTTDQHRLVLKVHFGWSTDANLGEAASRLAVGAPLGAVTKDYDDSVVRVRRAFGSVVVEAWSTREQVCVRRQVGTRTVKRPDPEVDVPMVEVEEPVYEYDCPPILAGGDA